MLTAGRIYYTVLTRHWSVRIDVPDVRVHREGIIIFSLQLFEIHRARVIIIDVIFTIVQYEMGVILLIDSGSVKRHVEIFEFTV